MARIIAISNQKGGVGKTTTSVNLSACLAEAGYRVLVVDLDPQGNATSGLGIDKRALPQSMYDVLVREVPVAEMMAATEWPRLFVAGTNQNLVGAEIELASMMAREHRLKDALDAVDDQFDYVIMDCPPSLGLLTVNALTAAHSVLIPLQTEYFALEGLGSLTKTIQLIQRRLNPALEWEGVLLTLYDSRNKLCQEVNRDVRRHFGDKVFEQTIPRNVRLAESPSFGMPIIAYHPSAKGARAYRKLAAEVLEKHHGQRPLSLTRSA
jgi:chromosome partitioning protein